MLTRIILFLVRKKVLRTKIVHVGSEGQKFFGPDECGGVTFGMGPKYSIFSKTILGIPLGNKKKKEIKKFYY